MRKTQLTALTCIATALTLAASARVTQAQQMSAQDSVAQDATTQNYMTQAKLPPGAKVILVDDDRRQFRNAPYSYINNAIFAANPGDVIRVAPGIYREAVVINKSVRLEGAQFGRSAAQGNRLANASPAQESIIVMGPNLLDLTPLPNTIVTVRADNASMDGFSIQGEGSGQYRVGVGMVAGVPGFSLLNSRVENATSGILLTDQTNVLIQGNAFLNNQDSIFPGSTVASQPGQGIGQDISQFPVPTPTPTPTPDSTPDANPTPTPASTPPSFPPLTNVAILSNTFGGNQETGIALGIAAMSPKPGDLPVGGSHLFNINISSNRFDASLSSKPSGAGVVLQNAQFITLKKNSIRGGSEVGIDLDSNLTQSSALATTISQNTISGVAGNGLFLSNSLLNAMVDRNTISNNGGNGVVLSEIGAYINAFNLFKANKVSDNGGAGFLVYYSIGNHLENNEISGNGSGISVDYSQDNQFKNNVIRNSDGDGIFANEAASGNVFTGNLVKSSGHLDISDISVGDGTAGTDDIYRGNKATTANPAALATAK